MTQKKIWILFLVTPTTIFIIEKVV